MGGVSASPLFSPSTTTSDSTRKKTLINIDISFPIHRLTAKNHRFVFPSWGLRQSVCLTISYECFPKVSRCCALLVWVKKFLMTAKHKREWLKIARITLYMYLTLHVSLAWRFHAQTRCFFPLPLTNLSLVFIKALASQKTTTCHGSLVAWRSLRFHALLFLEFFCSFFPSSFSFCVAKEGMATFLICLSYVYLLHGTDDFIHQE